MMALCLGYGPIVGVAIAAFFASFVLSLLLLGVCRPECDLPCFKNDMYAMWESYLIYSFIIAVLGAVGIGVILAYAC